MICVRSWQMLIEIIDQGNILNSVAFCDYIYCTVWEYNNCIGQSKLTTSYYRYEIINKH